MKKSWIMMLTTSLILLVVAVIGYALPDFKYKNSSSMMYNYYGGGNSFPGTTANVSLWLELLISMAVISAVISIFVLIMAYVYENTTYNKYAIFAQIPFVFIAFFSGIMLLAAGCLNLGSVNQSDKLAPILILTFINIGYFGVVGAAITTGIVEYKTNSLK
ncbi:hypothetical protein [Spiroplasma turonicum]|uniref:Transmembrane protein n=1 Tax=Spiroplasma turonicum TaxID=216946 RepID=A0A0K1P742_9MOLU|nr:hypothetical protein [Spiroplasma turonicum]AKU79712.1 hypothetical protein STURON_00466 [Spiroplasma turonicum]ALX70730.1 hypothetical protein STURO_v1c04640 [Spiroplasma turonicum]